TPVHVHDRAIGHGHRLDQRTDWLGIGPALAPFNETGRRRGWKVHDPRRRRRPPFLAIVVQLETQAVDRAAHQAASGRRRLAPTPNPSAAPLAGGAASAGPRPPRPARPGASPPHVSRSPPTPIPRVAVPRRYCRPDASV